MAYERDHTNGSISTRTFRASSKLTLVVMIRVPSIDHPTNLSILKSFDITKIHIHAVCDAYDVIILIRPTIYSCSMTARVQNGSSAAKTLIHGASSQQQVLEVRQKRINESVTVGNLGRCCHNLERNCCASGITTIGEGGRGEGGVGEMKDD